MQRVRAVPRTCHPESLLELWNPVSLAVKREESFVLKQPIWKNVEENIGSCF